MEGLLIKMEIFFMLIKVSQDMNALGKDPQEEVKKNSIVLPIKLKSYKFKFPE